MNGGLSIRTAVLILVGLLLGLMPRTTSVSFAESPYLRIEPGGHTSSITRLSTDNR
jgi:hypothetical protein